MEVAEIQEQVKNLSLFADLNESDRGLIADIFTDVSDVYRYGDGEALIHVDYLSFDTGFLLAKGSASVENGRGDPIVINSPALLGEMSQFRVGDLRSATVRSQDECIALQFFWADLYAHAEEKLPGAVYSRFRQSIEHQVWDRFQFKNLTELHMFAGLDEGLRVRVCQPFSTLSERLKLANVDILFNQGSLCQATGYLVVSGSLKLYKKEKGEKIIQVPDIVGVFPGKSEKGAEWTATAMANGEAELLKFSWDQYSAELVRRLTREEQHAYVASIKEHGAKHFWH